MQVSKKKLNPNIEKQIENIFLQLLSDVDSLEEASVLTRDLLSQTERQAIIKRLAIAIFLEKGRSYENIKSFLKVSSATIASVNEKMGDPGFQLALQKVKAAQWADSWTKKISRMANKVFSSE